ncbi:uncharacterized protein [Apostichopus japonicus]|uniref:uncharacterized protein isoform X3 n=3 Tax=Stichopus japonicus TaxID=307972 RepID=UPI003AB6FAAB
MRNMPELGGFDMALPVFHAYGHKLHCQMSYSTRWKKAFGRTDGECMERLWSFLRKFSHITKEMTQSHRIDLLSNALLHYSACKLANLSTLLCVSLQKAKDITKQSESKLSRICQEFTVTMNTIKSWHEEAKTILAMKQKTSKQINLSWKEINVKNLDLYQALWNSLTADETKLLEEYWCNGLQSYGSSLNKKKTLELTKQTSLSARRIKNWIDNKKTKQVRRKFGSRSKVPSLKPRKKSAYSCFMAEYISEHDGNIT